MVRIQHREKKDVESDKLRESKALENISIMHSNLASWAVSPLLPSSLMNMSWVFLLGSSTNIVFLSPFLTVGGEQLVELNSAECSNPRGNLATHPSSWRMRC